MSIELKFTESDKPFREYLDEIVNNPPPIIDLVHMFPLFTGYINLGRYLTFYEMYKQTYELAGHIADIGTYKGASFMMFAKLVKLFEPYTYTQVHAYDWFEGMKPQDGEDDTRHAGDYAGDYETLRRLVEIQGLSEVACIHKMYLTKDLPEHFKEYHHLRFKLCFMDCGITSVLEEAIKHFWPRIVKGGIMILDHYSLPVSPHEADIIEKHTNCKIRQCTFTRQPTAYVIKE